MELGKAVVLGRAAHSLYFKMRLYVCAKPVCFDVITYYGNMWKQIRMRKGCCWRSLAKLLNGVDPIKKVETHFLLRVKTWSRIFLI